MFYLGLAEHMVPRVPPIHVPPRLQEICAIASSGGKLALSSLDASMYPECVKLIREMMGSLLGIDPERVRLPTEQMGTGDRASANEASIPSERTEGMREIIDDLPLIPPPVAFSRTKSFDSVMDNNEALLTGGGKLFEECY